MKIVEDSVFFELEELRLFKRQVQSRLLYCEQKHSIDMSSSKEFDLADCIREGRYVAEQKMASTIGKYMHESVFYGFPVQTHTYSIYILKEPIPNFNSKLDKTDIDSDCTVNPAPVAKARDYTSDKVDIIQHTSFEVEKRAAREVWLQIRKFPYEVKFYKPDDLDGWDMYQEVLDEPSEEKQAYIDSAKNMNPEGQ